jgi:type II secretory pathway component PulF
MAHTAYMSFLLPAVAVIIGAIVGYVMLSVMLAARWESEIP